MLDLVVAVWFGGVAAWQLASGDLSSGLWYLVAALVLGMIPLGLDPATSNTRLATIVKHCFIGPAAVAWAVVVLTRPFSGHRLVVGLTAVVLACLSAWSVARTLHDDRKAGADFQQD